MTVNLSIARPRSSENGDPSPSSHTEPAPSQPRLPPPPPLHLSFDENFASESRIEGWGNPVHRAEGAYGTRVNDRLPLLLLEPQDEDGKMGVLANIEHVLVLHCLFPGTLA